MMSGLYAIPVSGIKEGDHLFEFEIKKAFFDLFEESEIKEGELIVVAEIEKSPSHLDLNIKISGKVRICCDRCLEMFDHPVDCENRLLVKFGTKKDESDPEIIAVPRDEHELDLKQYLYEFIHLALPIKRIHPDGVKGMSTCDPVMLQKLKEHLVEEETGNDPRWDNLKNLINDN
ncbi:MAG: hypothetical protein A2V46_10135 [Bacteroidetes bacterium RBG_19FT_COMBO_42_7]|nr:MAG: hypothetical protein A2Y71_07000 [Bacteroidetes bacterium RBG_13_42_15]OFY78701.1 MAG: hypothetical protein A2V46_10135 [Bacteroidetes bacterium RBG_19FT_COMBO_42_7]